MNAEEGLSKVERLILPVSALVIFAGEDIKMLLQGNWEGIVAAEGGYLANWHPPTLAGATNAVFHGPIGQGIGIALAGWGLDQVGKIMRSAKIGRFAKILSDSGEGVILGGTADMLVRPTKYNSTFAQGMTSPGMGDSVMRNPSRYEPVGKPTQKAFIGFR